MCTALCYRTKAAYFGRNLDLEYAYQEQVTIMPRHFVIPFRTQPPLREHYAMIGMAFVPDGIPLFYDAVNEKGLGMAGLNFPNEAVYLPPESGGVDIAPFELIPWVLSQCATIEEARRLLSCTRVAAIDYSKALPSTPLHWFLCDKHGSAAVEPLQSGLHVTDDPIEVLTNSPPLSYHLTRLADFTALSAHTPPSRFGDTPVSLYSRGMGAMGLPGDFSSNSRFVKAAFVKTHAVCDGSEMQSVNQTFHILDSVAHPRGCVCMPDGRQEITLYSSCCNLYSGVYYYKTYENSAVTAVAMQGEDLDSGELTVYPLQVKPTVMYQNGITAPSQCLFSDA